MLAESESGDYDAVQQCLDARVSVDAVYEKGASALLIAAENGFVEIVRLLLDRGATVDLADEDGGTALCMVTSNNCVVVLRDLADRDSVVTDRQRQNRATALHCAAMNGCGGAIELRRRNPIARGKHGRLY